MRGLEEREDDAALSFDIARGAVIPTDCVPPCDLGNHCNGTLIT
jgi:hypothetical protein